jgi:type I restriction enzyme, S subunit
MSGPRRRRRTRRPLNSDRMTVFGVDRQVGLTLEPRYQSKDLTRYKLVKPGMFVYNPMRLNIGSIGFCREELGAGVTSPDYVVFGCEADQLNPLFLRYHTQTAPWANAVALSGEGSVRERIYYRKLANYTMELPSIEYQNKAVATLGALDDKIELNRKMNATLEAMARALFATGSSISAPPAPRWKAASPTSPPTSGPSSPTASMPRASRRGGEVLHATRSTSCN